MNLDQQAALPLKSFTYVKLYLQPQLQTGAIGMHGAMYGAMHCAVHQYTRYLLHK